MLYREGGPPRCALVRSGLIRVLARSAQGRQVTVRYARPGDLLGVAAAVAGPSPVAAQALLDSTLLFFDATALADEARRDARITQQQLADAVGSAREVVARTLRSFRNQGLVRTRPGGVVLVGAEAMARIAQGEPERV